MTTAWTRTAAQICDSALGHLGVLASGETAAAADVTLCLGALDGVLKELPIYGYVWPKLSAEAALVWAAGAAINLPSDYYGGAVAWKLLNGQTVPLTPIPHADWIQKIDRAATSTTLTHFYITPANAFTPWPIVTADPTVTVQYQRIVNDAASGSAPDVLQFWMLALPWGVANDVSMDFGLDAQKRTEIAQRWGEKRAMALASSIPSEVISFEVRE